MKKKCKYKIIMSTSVSTNIIVKDTIYLDGGCSIHTEPINGQTNKKLVLHTHDSSGNKIEKDVTDIGSGGGGSITWSNHTLNDGITTIIQGAVTSNLNFLSWDNAQASYKTIDIKNSGAMNPSLSDEVATSKSIKQYLDVNYAAITHNHDASYAAITHNHDASYAAITHNHDASYAPRPSSTKIQKWASTTWEDALLSDISNVNLENLIDGQYLKWNNSQKKWIPGSPTGSGATHMSELNDVDITGLVADSILVSKSDDGGGFVYVNKEFKINLLTDVNISFTAGLPLKINSAGDGVDSGKIDLQTGITSTLGSGYLKWDGSVFSSDTPELHELGDVNYNTNPPTTPIDPHTVKDGDLLYWNQAHTHWMPLTLDTSVTSGSTKPVTGGAIHTELETKASKDLSNSTITGTTGEPLKIKSGGSGVESGKIDLQTGVNTSLADGYLKVSSGGFNVLSELKLNELEDVDINNSDITTKGIFFNMNSEKYEDVIMANSTLPLQGLDIDQSSIGLSCTLANGDLTVDLNNVSEEFLGKNVKHSYIYCKLEDTSVVVNNIIILGETKIRNGGQIMIEISQTGATQSTSTLAGIYETADKINNLRMKSTSMPADFTVEQNEVLLVTLYKTYGGVTNKYYMNADVYNS